MKRALLIVGGIVLVLVALLGTTVALTFMGRKPVVDGFETGGIRIVADGIVTVAMVPVGPGQVALVDAGNDADGTAILAELSRRGLGPDAVVAILLTHGHPDHIAAVRRFPKAEVMALQREAALVEGREAAGGPVEWLVPVSETGITVNRPLQDGDSLMLGTVPVRVFAIPGHTAGSAAYLINGALFIGDSGDADSDGRLQGSAWIFSESQDQNRESLARLLRRLRDERLEVVSIVPAHSGVLTDGLTQLDGLIGIPLP